MRTDEVKMKTGNPRLFTCDHANKIEMSALTRQYHTIKVYTEGQLTCPHLLCKYNINGRKAQHPAGMACLQSLANTVECN